MDEDRESKIANPNRGRTPLFRLIRTLPAKIAVAYWILVLLVFFSLQLAGFDMIGRGVAPVILVTVPWSLLVIKATSSLSPAAFDTFLKPLDSIVGTFVMLVVLCGGLNAILIFMLLSWIERLRHRR